MNEYIYTIVLLSVDCLFGIASIFIVFFWRKRKFCKQIHRTPAALCFFILNSVFIIGEFLLAFLPFSDRNIAASNVVITILFVFNVSFFLVAIHFGCFCLFLDGKVVIERTLFRETLIDLTKDSASLEYEKHVSLTIYNNKGIIIDCDLRLDYRGCLELFVNNCEAIINKDIICQKDTDECENKIPD